MKKNGSKIQTKEQKNELIDAFKTSLTNFHQKNPDGFLYPLIIPPSDSLDEDALFEIYPDLLKIGKREKLNVLLYSYGGNAHKAFHIGRLLQDYSSKELIIYVLHEAKSAATLLACAADKIIFSEISELGPMDPQIKEVDIERRFSPLAIKHILEFLSEESKKGHQELVSSLSNRLPSPLILGEHLKSLETGKEYLYRLLKSRMFKDEDDSTSKVIAEKLVIGYPDHSYCIDLKEAQEIGLIAEKASTDIETELFEVMKSYKAVWDEFEQKLKNSKGKEELFQEAVKLLVDLRECVREIIELQLTSNK